MGDRLLCTLHGSSRRRGWDCSAMLLPPPLAASDGWRRLPDRLCQAAPAKARPTGHLALGGHAGIVARPERALSAAARPAERAAHGSGGAGPGRAGKWRAPPRGASRPGPWRSWPVCGPQAARIRSPPRRRPRRGGADSAASGRRAARAHSDAPARRTARPLRRQGTAGLKPPGP